MYYVHALHSFKIECFDTKYFLHWQNFQFRHGFILLSIFLNENMINDKDIAKYCHISLSRALHKARGSPCFCKVWRTLFNIVINFVEN
jgi:hypothetical protein